MPEMTFHPLTQDRWADFEMLFGECGAVGGCWCITWRLTQSQYETQKRENNRQTMRGIVDSGEVPGIVGSTLTGSPPGGVQ